VSNLFDVFVGSLGVVLTVPITALIASFLAVRKK